MAEKPSPDYGALKAMVQELAKGPADTAAIEAKLKKLSTEGIPRKTLNRDEIIAHKQEILERVQKRAEEYEFLTHSCAKGSALAVMEEFGLGNIEIITALSSFPGIAGTGEVCGGVSGGLIAIGLYFGSDNPLDYEATTQSVNHSRQFLTLFQKELGSTKCRDIQEAVIFGRFMDSRASAENREAFIREGGYEKCALPTGIGARLAAQVIIESMDDEAKAS